MNINTNNRLIAKLNELPGSQRPPHSNTYGTAINYHPKTTLHTRIIRRRNKDVCPWFEGDERRGDAGQGVGVGAGGEERCARDVGEGGGKYGDVEAGGGWCRRGGGRGRGRGEELKASAVRKVRACE